MKMSGEHKINAPRDEVWAALNDPDVLQASIPGCKALSKTADDAFEATVQAKVGPVKANFKGKVTLSDIDPPNGYRISGEGSGGAAGFAKGGADVRLSEADGGATLLGYDVDATVGGKLAQIGQRLVDSTARKMADDFFTRFSAHVEGARPAAEAQPPAPSAPAPSTPASEAAAGPASEPPVQPAAPIPPAPAPAPPGAAPVPQAPDRDHGIASATGGDPVARSAAGAAEEAVEVGGGVDGATKERDVPRPGNPIVWVVIIAVVIAVLIYLFQ